VVTWLRKKEHILDGDQTKLEVISSTLPLCTLGSGISYQQRFILRMQTLLNVVTLNGTFTMGEFIKFILYDFTMHI
jgi:hypothetical protein